MPSVQIKDVPEQTHAVLRQRAAAAHQSLQEYLRTRLSRTPNSRRWTKCWSGPVDDPEVRYRSTLRWLSCATTVLVVDASVIVVALADDGGDRRLARAPGPRCRIEVFPATP